MKRNKPRPGPSKRIRMTKNSHLIVALYLDSCDPLPDHTDDICDTGEHGRIGSVAIIKQGFVFTNPEDEVEWTDGINAGNITILPEVSGEYDGGKAKDGPGYARAKTTFLGADHKIKYADPTYKANIAFYNLLRKTRSYTFAFCTETQVHIVTAPCTFRPMAPVKNDTESTVVWEVEVEWSAENSPLAYNIPAGIFVASV